LRHPHIRSSFSKDTGDKNIPKFLMFLENLRDIHALYFKSKYIVGTDVPLLPVESNGRLTIL
jgi:hypothetical protein